MRTKEQFKEYVYAKANEKVKLTKKQRMLWIRSVAAFSLLLVIGGVILQSRLSNDHTANEAQFNDANDVKQIESFSAKGSSNYSYYALCDDADLENGAELEVCNYLSDAVNMETYGKSESEAVVPSFSYEEENIDDAGVIRSGFKNLDIVRITDINDAIARATKECTISYNTTSVYYDNTLDIWKVVFSTSQTLGDCQSVYLNGNGTTCLIIYGE